MFSALARARQPCLALIADQREHRCGVTAALVASRRCERSGASWAHLGLALLVAAGVFTQVYLIGAYIFGAGQEALDAHRPVGFTVHGFEVLILVTALLAWLPPAPTSVSRCSWRSAGQFNSRCPARRNESARCTRSAPCSCSSSPPCSSAGTCAIAAPSSTTLPQPPRRAGGSHRGRGDAVHDAAVRARPAVPLWLQVAISGSG
jgi:hypothetical protein